MMKNLFGELRFWSVSIYCFWSHWFTRFFRCRFIVSSIFRQIMRSFSGGFFRFKWVLFQLLTFGTFVFSAPFEIFSLVLHFPKLNYLLFCCSNGTRRYCKCMKTSSKFWNRIVVHSQYFLIPLRHCWCSLVSLCFNIDDALSLAAHASHAL